MTTDSTAADRPSSHPLPDGGAPDPRTWRLQVDGLVKRPMSFSLDDLEQVGSSSHQGSFTCVGGWADGDLAWSGAPLSAILEIVEPLATATALYSYAPGYRALVPLEAAPTAILATRLDDALLTPNRGAPCRLVVTDPSCQLSVKWISHLEVIVRAPDAAPGPRRPE